MTTLSIRSISRIIATLSLTAVATMLALPAHAEGGEPGRDGAVHGGYVYKGRRADPDSHSRSRHSNSRHHKSSSSKRKHSSRDSHRH